MTSLVERVGEWPAQWLREGREEGREEGWEQGIAHERALLRRMAGTRFGAGTAERPWGTAEHWMRMQASHDLAQERPKQAGAGA